MLSDVHLIFRIVARKRHTAYIFMVQKIHWHPRKYRYSHGGYTERVNATTPFRALLNLETSDDEDGFQCQKQNTAAGAESKS
jgi:hypothetical protein